MRKKLIWTEIGGNPFPDVKIVRLGYRLTAKNENVVPTSPSTL